MKALNGFLTIQRQMTLKVLVRKLEKERKLHRPRMSDGFLAGSVGRYDFS